MSTQMGMVIVTVEKGKTVMGMAEYIEREEAIEAAKHAWAKDLEPTQYIEIIPAADVEPVKRGRWLPQILNGTRIWDCSECKTIGSPEWKRCPVCEAKMDEEAKHATNADKIRAMSDEEITEFVCRNGINTLCDIICGGECNAIASFKKSGDEACKEIVMNWLQQPSEEVDHEDRIG